MAKIAVPVQVVTAVAATAAAAAAAVKRRQISSAEVIRLGRDKFTRKWRQVQGGCTLVLLAGHERSHRQRGRVHGSNGAVPEAARDDA